MRDREGAPPATFQDADLADGRPLPQQEQVFRAPVRFGHVPVAREPLGWEPKRPGFRNHYPDVRLPTQIVERVSLGAPALEPNRLIWGDNLHAMRTLPSESVDLIYIDPPFFSNREYNVIWGDANEERSFSDIWEGGLDGYLIWLNARLYEMARLLKPTGSIYVHCDWHASHYIKVEMDRIFGHENFRSDIVWRRTNAKGLAFASYPNNADTLLYYGKGDVITWSRPYRPHDPDYVEKFYRHVEQGTGRRYRLGDLTNPNPNRPNLTYEFLGVTRVWRWTQERMHAAHEAGRVVQVKPGAVPSYKRYLDEMPGTPIDTIWDDIGPIQAQSAERVGYPTQKPEALIERIIKASSNERDVVLDAFVGGGTTPVVAQRLGRRWIAIDQSRVAVAVTAERLKTEALEPALGDAPLPDFTVEHWGVYEMERLAQASPAQFRAFVLTCYDARIPSDDQGIHGYKGEAARVPVWVGAPELTTVVEASDVDAFAQAIARLDRYQSEEGLRDGVMLAWGFSPAARAAAAELRQRADVDLAFVRLKQVRIDSPGFREHIAAQSTDRGDYSGFLTFVQPPLVEVAHRRVGTLDYEFDAGDTLPQNPDATIINVQWDFNYDGATFRAARGEWFHRKGKGGVPVLAARHTFARPGTFHVGCRVQDDKGGEGEWSGRVEVE